MATRAQEKLIDEITHAPQYRLANALVDMILQGQRDNYLRLLEPYYGRVPETLLYTMLSTTQICEYVRYLHQWDEIRSQLSWLREKSVIDIIETNIESRDRRGYENAYAMRVRAWVMETDPFFGSMYDYCIIPESGNDPRSNEGTGGSSAFLDGSPDPQGDPGGRSPG